MKSLRLLAPYLLLLTLHTAVFAADGNRLAYLDAPCDPYYVGRQTAKLVTPQWVGEEGVEAVIVLATDDLRDTAKHEAFLRPIHDRLKHIDGRGAVSLMTNQVDPGDPQLQRWLQEGASLEAHTWTHPCPCLQNGDLAAARQSYDKAVDLMATVPNNHAVAFRMPCCDSMSSVSPRFFTEIFNQVTPAGRFLSLDSSVFHLFTADDPELPRELVRDAEGRERFRKYVPTDRVMANLIEDYPYPYVIDRLCWEFPCLMPSDWDAQHLNGVCSPLTVADLKAAVDAAVIKRGVFSLVFHPHGWLRNDQVVEMIDHAVAKHGKKVKFLNFREVHDRITENVLGGQPLRAADGGDNGVRVADLNGDGYMDVVVANQHVRQSRIWSPETNSWQTSRFPDLLIAVEPDGHQRDQQVRFAVLQRDGSASALSMGRLWHLTDQSWEAGPYDPDTLVLDGPIHTEHSGRDQGVRFRDLDCDGVCELIVGNPRQNGVLRWTRGGDGWGWSRLPFALPEGTAFVDAEGRDAGLRLVDVDEDGHLDVVFSNAQRCSIHLFASMQQGWARKVLSGRHGAPAGLPPIVRANGTNNGAWFKFRHMWVQNEDTGNRLPGHVDSRSFSDMLPAAGPPPAP